MQIPLYHRLTTSPISSSNRNRNQIYVCTTTRNCVIVIGVLPEQLRDPVEPVTSYTQAETRQQASQYILNIPQHEKGYTPSHPPNEVLFHCNPVALRKKSAVP